MQQFEMYHLTNWHHDRMKKMRHDARVKASIYRVAKKAFAVAGCMLFLLCLWMLA